MWILTSTLLVLVRADSDQFHSIQSLAKSEVDTFALPQPQLDLSPTSLALNAPMIMSLPELEQNLAETEFAKNSPMSFNITQPTLDLVPSFTIKGGNGEEYKNKEDVSEPVEDVSDDVKDVSEPAEDDKKDKSDIEQLPLEPQIYPKKDKEESERKKRGGDRTRSS